MSLMRPDSKAAEHYDETMASSGSSDILLNFLNTEEYNLIPDDVRAKITSHFVERFEEFLTSKALFESSRTNYGKSSHPAPL